jgi:Beta-lactamase class A
MDIFIKENLDKAKIQISYMSLDNARDQYHRNANQVIQSHSLIKLPVYLKAISNIKKGHLSLEENFILKKKELLINHENLYTAVDADSVVNTQQLLEAIAQYDDNTAANTLLAKIGKDNLKKQWQTEKLSSLYLFKPFNEHHKNEVQQASNFISTADLVKYQKITLKTITGSRKGRQLLESFLTSTDIPAKAKQLEWSENTKLAKGINSIVYGKQSYILCIVISQFETDPIGLELLKKAQSIFSSRLPK